MQLLCNQLPLLPQEPTDAMEEVELVDSRQAGPKGGSADDDTAEPEGELEEHAPLAGSGQDSAAFTQTKYISLDPTRLAFAFVDLQTSFFQ